jgi:hypothetical protein
MPLLPCSRHLQCWKPELVRRWFCYSVIKGTDLLLLHLHWFTVRFNIRTSADMMTYKSEISRNTISNTKLFCRFNTNTSNYANTLTSRDTRWIVRDMELFSSVYMCVHVYCTIMWHTFTSISFTHIYQHIWRLYPGWQDRLLVTFGNFYISLVLKVIEKRTR